MFIEKALTKYLFRSNYAFKSVHHISGGMQKGLDIFKDIERVEN